MIYPSSVNQPANHAFGHVAAVVVTYNSGPEIIKNIEAILPQVDRIILVDNASEGAAKERLRELAYQHRKLEIIENKQNFGLAAAQNQGIRRAIACEADWVLLLDDDSEAAPDMIQAMWQAYDAAEDKAQIGICAPNLQDVQGKKHYRYLKARGRWWFDRQGFDADTSRINDVWYVIASGSLVKRAVFETAGLMREEFFIDFIDWEFCARVREQWLITVVRDA